MRNKRLAAVVLGGALALGGAGMAAADSGHPAPPASSTESTQPRDPGARMKAVFDTLVSDGTITQAQEDKILAKLQAEFEAHKAEAPPREREGGHPQPPRPGDEPGATTDGSATK